MDISLVILAAGIGARYGGVKQLEPVGPNGELIIDYSIHDAIAAGFNKIVFIIRPDIYDDFREVIGNRMEKRFQELGVKWDYVFQTADDLPEGRKKPWGTGHALLMCREVLHEPFAVINADDYYGRGAFSLAAGFLKQHDSQKPFDFGMVGFSLKNTLSENGGVTRGVCQVDGNGYLTRIRETHGIVKTPEGAAVGSGSEAVPLDPESVVSMNFWMMTPTFVESLAGGFASFRANLMDPEKDEFLLPTIVDGLLQGRVATVKVLPSDDRWFGVTYREDKQSVADAFRALYAMGVYNKQLYADIPAKQKV